MQTDANLRSMSAVDFIDLDQHVSDISKRGDEGLEAAALILELADSFDDLKPFKGPGFTGVCSKEVNPMVEGFELVGEPMTLEVWPFAMVYDDPAGDAEPEEIYAVYGNPPCLVVADANPKGFGLQPREGWDKEVVSHGFPEEMVEEIREYLKTHPPINYLD